MVQILIRHRVLCHMTRNCTVCSGLSIPGLSCITVIFSAFYGRISFIYDVIWVKLVWNTRIVQQFTSTSVSILHLSQPTTNPTICNQQRLRPACTSTSMPRVLVYPCLDSLEVGATCDQRRLWSDCANAQADLSLCWSHKSYCRFCLALAYLVYACEHSKYHLCMAWEESLS